MTAHFKCFPGLLSLYKLCHGKRCLSTSVASNCSDLPAYICSCIRACAVHEAAIPSEKNKGWQEAYADQSSLSTYAWRHFLMVQLIWKKKPNKYNPNITLLCKFQSPDNKRESELFHLKTQFYQVLILNKKKKKKKKKEKERRNYPYSGSMKYANFTYMSYSHFSA